MPILTHGSDLSLAPTLRPFVETGKRSPRRALTAVADSGFTAVQFDATLAGVRPRELDTSARRDLAATARRSGLSISGIDLLIPVEHYRDPARIDRAADALRGALSLAADLGRVPVSIHAPDPEVDQSLLNDLLVTADGYGVPLSLLATDEHRTWLNWLEDQGAPVGMSLDPAALLIAKNDPVTAAQTLGSHLYVARLSDARRGQSDGLRAEPGAGDLDLTAYRVAVDLAPARLGPVVLDLRMLNDPLSAAMNGKRAWDTAAVSF